MIPCNAQTSRTRQSAVTLCQLKVVCLDCSLSCSNCDPVFRQPAHCTQGTAYDGYNERKSDSFYSFRWVPSEPRLIKNFSLASDVKDAAERTDRHGSQATSSPQRACSVDSVAVLLTMHSAPFRICSWLKIHCIHFFFRIATDRGHTTVEIITPEIGFTAEIP